MVSWATFSSQVTFHGHTMGTTYTVKVQSQRDQGQLKLKLKERVEKKLKQVNAALSTYQKDSEVSLINQGSAEKVFSLGPFMKKILAVNVEVFEKSDGFFDPSVGPLVNLWGHGPQRHQNPPGPQAIASTLKLVGLKRFALSKNMATLQKHHDQAFLDFSASAKGLGVDEVANLLSSLGLSTYMVEIGGEIRVASSGKKVWQLAIERPLKNKSTSTRSTRNTRSIQKIVPLKTGALATSGNYRNYYTKDGVDVGHTINPLTGQTVSSDLLSVSVVDSTCARADAWATALLAMGLKKATQAAKRWKLKAFLITADKEVEIK